MREFLIATRDFSVVRLITVAACSSNFAQETEGQHIREIPTEIIHHPNCPEESYAIPEYYVDDEDNRVYASRVRFNLLDADDLPYCSGLDFYKVVKIQKAKDCGCHACMGYLSYRISFV